MSDVLTLEKLKEVMALVPQSVGYALLIPNSLYRNTAYKIMRDASGAHAFMPGDALYWLIVPRNFLAEAIKSLHATPSDDIPGEAYRFDVYSLLKDDIG